MLRARILVYKVSLLKCVWGIIEILSFEKTYCCRYVWNRTFLKWQPNVPRLFRLNQAGIYSFWAYTCNLKKSNEVKLHNTVTTSNYLHVWWPIPQIAFAKPMLYKFCGTLHHFSYHSIKAKRAWLTLQNSHQTVIWSSRTVRSMI